jgi:arylsulfatase A-like enzyme
MDIVPTILEAAGADIPVPIDGASMLDLIQAPESTHWREHLMCQHHGHGTPHFQRLLRYDNYKYVAHLDDRHELYDLKRDPYELQNLIEQPEHQNVLAKMQERLCRQMAHYGDDSDDAATLIHQIS